MGLENGPFVQAACFCDMAMEDKGGAVSLIRIVDTLTHVEGGLNPPEAMPPFTHPLWLAIMLKSGTARGRHELSIVPEQPSGETGTPIRLTVHLEGEEKGANVLAQTALQFTLEGLHWFNVYLDEDRLTRIPLRIRYNRVIAAASTTP